MYDYSDTLIGRDYLQKPKVYETDLLLDFLVGLLEMRSTGTGTVRDFNRYNREIDAVKHLLRMQTGISHAE